MAGKPPFLAVVSWLPQGLEKIESCVDGVRVVAGEDRDLLLEAFAEAEVAFVGAFDPGLLRVARKLRWVHSGSGGVEGYMFPQLAESPITLTCSKPCFDSTGAEYALGMMLAFSRRLHNDLRHRPDREWEWSVPGTLRSQGQWPTELKGKTVGIMGLGVMGSEIARVATCFGMRVIAMARTRRTPPQTVDRLLSPAQMDELLAGSDFVVLSLPLTPETRGSDRRARVGNDEGQRLLHRCFRETRALRPGSRSAGSGGKTHRRSCVATGSAAPRFGAVGGGKPADVLPPRRHSRGIPALHRSCFARTCGATARANPCWDWWTSRPGTEVESTRCSMRCYKNRDLTEWTCLNQLPARQARPTHNSPYPRASPEGCTAYPQKFSTRPMPRR